MRKNILTVLFGVALACTLLCAAGCQGSPSPAPSGSDTPASAANDANGATAGAAWSAGMDCALCHEAQCVDRTVYHEALPCTTCHEENAAFEKAHEGVTAESKMPSKLKATDVPQAVCESCHGTYADLAKETADVTVLTDSEGTTVNPHEVVIQDSAEHDVITCTSCHKEHTGEDVLVTAPNYCLSCHHDNVYECYTCHE